MALLSTVLLAGLLFDFWAFITPALATLPGPTFVAVTQAIDRQFLVPIVFVYLVVDFSGLAVVLLLLRERRSPAFALTTAALVATLVGTASTLLINVPINVEVINTWSPQARARAMSPKRPRMRPPVSGFLHGSGTPPELGLLEPFPREPLDIARRWWHRCSLQ